MDENNKDCAITTWAFIFSLFGIVKIGGATFFVVLVNGHCVYVAVCLKGNIRESETLKQRQCMVYP